MTLDRTFRPSSADEAAMWVWALDVSPVIDELRRTLGVLALLS